MRNPMELTDGWTIWMTLIALIQILVAMLTIRRTKDYDYIANTQ
jgi:hypothetical protein